MQEWITGIIGQYGYWGILFLLALESVFPPIPSEVILTFGGFLTTRTLLTPIGTVAFATIGSVAGAVILYYIGALLGQERLEELVRRRGRLLRIRPGDIQKTYHWFSRYEKKAVFFCRMIPLVRSLISIPAGMARMSMPTFLILTSLGSLIWNTILVTAGALLGESWGKVVSFFQVYSRISCILIGIGVIIIALAIVRRRQK